MHREGFKVPETQTSLTATLSSFTQKFWMFSRVSSANEIESYICQLGYYEKLVSSCEVTVALNFGKINREDSLLTDKEFCLLSDSF